MELISNETTPFFQKSEIIRNGHIKKMNILEHIKITTVAFRYRYLVYQ